MRCFRAYGYDLLHQNMILIRKIEQFILIFVTYPHDKYEKTVVGIYFVRSGLVAL